MVLESEMLPAEWVAMLRQRHGVSGPAAPSAQWLSKYLARLPESQRAVARAVWERRQGKTINESLDHMILPYLKHFGTALNREEHLATKDIWYAFLPTFEFNAHATRTPRGDRVVLLHQTLSYTLSFWSHWYLRLSEEKHDYLAADPRKLREVLDFFGGLWRGSPPALDPGCVYPRTQESWELDDALTTAALVFVLGHELGHIMKGHRGYDADPEKNHEMEFEADRVGLAITVRHALERSGTDPDTYSIKYRLFAPLFAAAVISFQNDTDSRTHPAASRRRNRLIAAIPQELHTFFGDAHARMMEHLDGEELYAILDRNSKGVFDAFARYRRMAPEAARAYKTPAPAWLASECPHRWR
jgi:hypothetical protein